MKKCQKYTGVHVFVVSIADINKMLEVKKFVDLVSLLLSQYHHYLLLFDFKKTTDLSSLCGYSVDHRIELIKENDKKIDFPWGSLYNMSRDELLVLHKELMSLLDKDFICVSNSSATVLVLFAKKLDGDLRFYIDYRALNKIMKKDRYPFSLIHETLI